MVERSPYPGTPNWVKALAIVALTLAAALIVLTITGVRGEHGPDRHMCANTATDTSSSGSDTNAPQHEADHRPPPGVH